MWNCIMCDWNPVNLLHKERFCTCDFYGSSHQRHRHTYNCCDTFKRKIDPSSEEVASFEVHTLREGQEEIERDRNTERGRMRRRNRNHCPYLFQVNEYMIYLPRIKFKSHEETKFFIVTSKNLLVKRYILHFLIRL
jgi:hypothetical protein